MTEPEPSTSAAPGVDRTELWLPLLRALTTAVPGWCVWKNAASAFAGTGDIDAAAPDAAWPEVTRVFVEWARERNLGPVIVCRHIPGGLNLVAVPHDAATLLEMGTKARRVWRGTTLFTVDDLRPLIVMDDRGFRTIRTGAEGLLKLALNGIRWSGRPNVEGLRGKRVAEQLAADPEGVRLAARLFGPAAPAAVAAATAAAQGAWDYRAVTRLQLWAVSRAAAQPSVLAQRVRFRLRGREQCPVTRTLLNEQRRIPSDRERWLDEVRRTHEVHA